MAGGLIGSLRVALGLDSAQFTTGLAKARGELGSFSSAAKIGFAAVGAAALAAGTALGVAVKRSLDHADALGKAAQKAGVSTVALSRLEYAARLSDVSMEGLTGSLTKLGKAMVDATVNNGGQAAVAFKALGVNVRDTSGNMRDTNAVFLDVADKFSRVQDGAAKSALAMQIFGRSGAELIPLLNSGRDGLKQMADESDRVGFTLNTKTTDAAQAFNDALTKVGLGFDGISNRIMEAALPALTRFADLLTDPKLSQAATDLGVAIINALSSATPYIKNAASNLAALSDIFQSFQNKTATGQRAAIADIQNQITTLENNIAANKKRLSEGGAATLFGLNDASLKAQIDKDISLIQPLIDKMNELQRSVAPPATGGAFTGGWGSEGFKTADTGSGNGSPLNIDLSAFGKKQATPGGAWTGGWGAEGVGDYTKMMERLAPVLDKLHNPMESMKGDLADLGTLFAKHKITTEEYGQAVTRTYANVAASAFDMASGITGALASMFKDNKAFAVANAVVQTLSGVANAIGSGPPPWNFINAGIVAATGAANVANILSTNDHSTSVPGSGSGGAAPAAAAAAAPRQAVNISLQGASLFSTEMVEQLLNQMADAMGDGAGSRLINVVRA